MYKDVSKIVVLPLIENTTSFKFYSDINILPQHIEIVTGLSSHI